MKNELKNITDLIFTTHGIDISVYEDSFFVKSLEKRVDNLGLGSLGEYFDFLQKNESETSACLESLNINFSEFFRNPLTFAYLEQVVLPALIEVKKKSNENELRIWSAACAAGQEAYSIAILCDELRESSKAKISVRIFGTDINHAQLTKANNGVYQYKSISKVSLARINSCFTQKGETFTIEPRIKEYVNFSVFDLLSVQNACPASSVYGNFDMVICSNLLFYFKPEYQSQILEKIAGCLAYGGILITGEAEREIVKKSNYRELFVNSAIFQKR